MTEVIGKVGIVAKIILDSISEEGQRITTFELTYPRIIHAELMTHRMFSRNAASSRAIPFAKMQQQLTARPVRFGAANPGMQDKGGEHLNMVHGRFEVYDTGIGSMTNAEEWTSDMAWEQAKSDAIFWSEAFHDAGFHKQIYNRLTEPFQMMKTIVTATEFANFFWLRNDGAADPTLRELARCMFEAYTTNEPRELLEGEWHLPYVGLRHGSNFGVDQPVSWYYIIEDDAEAIISLEDAIKVSAARCAAVSFRNEDYGLEKCRQVHERLVGDERKHASAFEHQATPIQPYTRTYDMEKVERTEINNSFYSDTWEPGISHADREGNLWSANFKGFIQYRKLIPGENHDE